MVNVLALCLGVRVNGALSGKATCQAVTVFNPLCVCRVLECTGSWCPKKNNEAPTASHESRRQGCSRSTSWAAIAIGQGVIRERGANADSEIEGRFQMGGGAPCDLSFSHNTRGVESNCVPLASSHQ